MLSIISLKIIKTEENYLPHQEPTYILNFKVMVTDFGLSDYEEDLRPDSAVCGTATYLAPEVMICVSGTVK